MTHRRDEDEQRRQGAEHEDAREDQRRGEPERLAPLAALELLGEHRHERRLDRGVGEQAADQVGDLKGDRERRHRPLDPEVARGDDLAHEPGDPRERRSRSRRTRSSAPGVRRPRLLGRAGHRLTGHGLDVPVPGSRLSGAALIVHVPAGAIVSRRPMANIASQKKRILRSERERLENRRLTSAVEHALPPSGGAVEAGDAARSRPSTASSSRGSTRPSEGRAARNTGARKKSRAARLRAAA